MHTQTGTAEQITAAGGDYVFTVKGNQPSLHAACKAMPWKDVPAHRSVSTGHGCRVTRTIKVTAAPDWVEFPGAAQVAQVQPTTRKPGKQPDAPGSTLELVADPDEVVDDVPVECGGCGPTSG